MACLNCTTRVLRIFLYTSQLSLRPAQRRLLLPLPVRPATLQNPSYTRLTTHLATARKQSTLATLGGELTDDDYVPSEYHFAGAAPAAIGADVQSGWPPPAPKAGHMEREPDIELTSPHEEALAWWGGVEEQTVAAAEKKVAFLKREGYWTLDGSEKTYSLAPKNNKGKRKREREERERLAAKTLAPSKEKEIHDVVPTPPEEIKVEAPALASPEGKRKRKREREERERLAAKTLAPPKEKEIHDVVPTPPEEIKVEAPTLASPEGKRIDCPVSARVEEEKVHAAESTGGKEHQEVDNSTNNNIEVDSEGSAETLSTKAARKAAKKAAIKAARKACEEKKIEIEAEIALEEVQKQIRRERMALRGEAAGITDETTKEYLGTHRYDQFFSDSPKVTERTRRDPRETPKHPKHRKFSAETLRVPKTRPLWQERLLNPVLDEPESYELLQTSKHTNVWNIEVPSLEPTRLQKFVSTAPRNKIEPWMIYKARIQEKLQGRAWTPFKKLSPDAQEAIRVLRKNHPDISISTLSDKFKMSGDAIRRILKSKWRDREKTPEKAQEWAEKWVKRGQKVWNRWEAVGVVHTKKTKKKWRLQKAKVVQEKANVKVPMADMSDLSSRIS